MSALSRLARTPDATPSTAVAVPASFPSTGRAVRVNLLPTEVVTARRGRRARTLVVALLAALVVVLAVVSLLARAGTSDANDALSAAQAANADLVAQQRAFHEVVAAQAVATAAQQRVTALTATDVQWAKLMADVRAAAPSGLSLTGLTGEPPAGAGKAAAVASAPATTGGAATDPTGASAVVGTLSLGGTASDAGVVATFVDQLAAVTGLADVAATSVVADQGGVGYTFAVTANVTAAARAPHSTTGASR